MNSKFTKLIAANKLLPFAMNFGEMFSVQFSPFLVCIFNFAKHNEIENNGIPFRLQYLKRIQGISLHYTICVIKEKLMFWFISSVRPKTITFILKRRCSFCIVDGNFMLYMIFLEQKH